MSKFQEYLEVTKPSDEKKKLEKYEISVKKEVKDFLFGSMNGFLQKKSKNEDDDLINHITVLIMKHKKIAK
jgi:hypothetical protein